MKWLQEIQAAKREFDSKLFDDRLKRYYCFLSTFARGVELHIEVETSQVEAGAPLELTTKRDAAWDAFMTLAYECSLICNRDVRAAMDALLKDLDTLEFTEPDGYTQGLQGNLSKVIGAMREELRAIQVTVPGLELKAPLRPESREEPLWLSTFSKLKGNSAAPPPSIATAAGVLPTAATPSPGHPESFWLNSCERYYQNSFAKMLEHGVACTYGPESKKAMLTRLDVGQRVFLFVSGRGIVAMGTVANAVVTTKAAGTNMTGANDTEYSIPVNWSVRCLEKPVNADEIRAAGNRLFVTTFFRLDSQVGENLAQLVVRNST